MTVQKLNAPIVVIESLARHHGISSTSNSLLVAPSIFHDSTSHTEKQFCLALEKFINGYLPQHCLSLSLVGFKKKPRTESVPAQRQTLSVCQDRNRPFQSASTETDCQPASHLPPGQAKKSGCLQGGTLPGKSGVWFCLPHLLSFLPNEPDLGCLPTSIRIYLPWQGKV